LVTVRFSQTTLERGPGGGHKAKGVWNSYISANSKPYSKWLSGVNQEIKKFPMFFLQTRGKSSSNSILLKSKSISSGNPLDFLYITKWYYLFSNYYPSSN
jgi:hypothetical protein